MATCNDRTESPTAHSNSATDDETKRISLINQSPRTVEVQLTITEDERGSGDTTFEEPIRVPKDDPQARTIPMQSGTYELTANVVDGPRGTYQWDVVVGRDTGLTIEIFTDRVEVGMWAE